MRKTVGKPRTEVHHAEEAPTREVDVERLGHVTVSSEDQAHPVENAFDTRRGPGGTEWVAGEPGAQTLVIAFDEPQLVHAVSLEVEEKELWRTQEIELALSVDGGATFETVRRQEYNFHFGGSTFESERWILDRPAVTHVRLAIRPDKGSIRAYARLTSLVVEGG